MLSYIRKSAQGWIIKTILWVLVAAFVGTIFLVWGHGGEQANENVVATIAGAPIHYREYQTYYTNLLETYRQLYGSRLNREVLSQLNLGQKALDQLVDSHLVSVEAQHLGLQVSDRDLSRRVQAIPIFQSNGNFDPQRYDSYLRLRGMQPQQFEALLRTELLQERYREFVAQAVKLTEDEIAEAYRQVNEKAKISYVRFPGSRYAPSVEVTDAEITSYYTANSAQFREPETRRVEYLTVKFADFEKDVEVSDDQAGAYYDEHKSEFLITKSAEASVSARHVLIKLKPTATEEERKAARATAEEVVGKAKAGEDFAELAKKYSQGTSAPTGGDLGFFTRSSMVKEFSDAAFAMRKGDISDVVESPFGFHVIKVEEVRAPKYKLLEEARESIVKKLKQEGSKSKAHELVNRILREDIEGLGFQALAERHKLERVEPPSFRQSQPIKGLRLRAAVAVAKAAFELELDGYSEPTETLTAIIFVHLLEVTPAYIPKQERITPKLKQAITRVKGRETAQRVTSNLARLIERTVLTFDDIIEDKANLVQRPKPFTRTGIIPGVGSSPELAALAFSKKAGSVDSFTVGNAAYLFRLEEFIPIDEKDFAKERLEFTAQLTGRKARSFYLAWLQELRQSAKVTINEAMLIQ